MVKVRLLSSIGGEYSGVEGEVIDLPDDIAESWVKAGTVEPIEELRPRRGRPPRGERAVQPPTGEQR